MKQILRYIIMGISAIIFVALVIAFIVETIKALPSLLLTIGVIGLFILVALALDKLFKK